MRYGILSHLGDIDALARGGGLRRLADLGFREVSVAVTEAGGRQIAPWATDGPVRELEDGVVHFRPSGSGPQELVPRTSRQVPYSGPTPLELALLELTNAGLEPWAWVRPLLDPRLGRTHPGSCLVDAFGRRHPEALCPARSEVQDHALALVEALASRKDGLAGIELQSMGFLGHRASVRQVESSLPADPEVDFLMSLCFCDQCAASMGRTGLEVGAIRDKVADLVRKRMADADAFEIPQTPRAEDAFRRLEKDLGEALLFTLWSHRLSVYIQLLRRVREQAGGRVKIALHAHFHSLFAGDAIGAPLKVVGSHVDEVVVEHRGQSAEAIARAWRAPRETTAPLRAAIWPRAPQFRSERDLRLVIDAVREHGGTGLRIGQLGLLPWRTLERIGSELLSVDGSRDSAAG